MHVFEYGFVRGDDDLVALVAYDFTPAYAGSAYCPGYDASVDIISVTTLDRRSLPLSGEDLGRIEEAALLHALEMQELAAEAAEEARDRLHAERRAGGDA